MGLTTKQSSSKFYKTIPADVMNDKQNALCYQSVYCIVQMELRKYYELTEIFD